MEKMWGGFTHSEVRMRAVQAFMYPKIQGQEPDYLGGGCYGAAFDLGGGLVLKVSLRRSDGWRAFAAWQLKAKCPNCMPILAYEDHDGYAFAVMPRGEPVQYRDRVQRCKMEHLFNLVRATRPDYYSRYSKASRWAKRLSEAGADYFLDLHRGNALVVRGRVVLSDPFGGRAGDSTDITGEF